MATYAIASLLSALSCLVAAALIGKYSSKTPLRLRASWILILLSGFFLSTYARTRSSQEHSAYLFILIIYTCAIPLPALFLDFTTLYTFSMRVRRYILAPAYLLSCLLVYWTWNGRLISQANHHDSLSFIGVPGNAYPLYLAYALLITLVTFCLLGRHYILSSSSERRAQRVFLASCVVGLVTMLSTLLPTFWSGTIPIFVYSAYLVPALVIYASCRYRFLAPSYVRPNLIVVATTIAASLLTLFLTLMLIEQLLLGYPDIRLTSLAVSVAAVLFVILALAIPALREYLDSMIYSRQEVANTVDQIISSLTAEPSGLSDLGARIVSAIKEGVNCQRVALFSTDCSDFRKQWASSDEGSDVRMDSLSAVNTKKTQNDREISLLDKTHGLANPAEDKIVKIGNVGSRKFYLSVSAVYPSKLLSRDLLFLGCISRKLIVALNNAAMFEETLKLASRIVDVNQRLEQETHFRTEELASRSTDVHTILDILNHDAKNSLVAASISLRQALTSLRMEVNSESATALHRVDLELLRLSELVSGLNYLFPSSGFEASTDRVSLLTVMKELSETVLRRYPLKVVSLSVGDLPDVQSQKEVINRVFFNLLDNAVKYVGDKGDSKISVSSHALEGVHEVTLKDNGIGIRIREIEKITRPFYRGSNQPVDTVEIGGMGLGLSIVDRLIKILGWGFKISSAPGMGTTVVLSIPGEQVLHRESAIDSR